MPVDKGRAAGALPVLAVGDAIGAGYEFGGASFRGTAELIGGGSWHFAPGEWTNDTPRAVCIAQVTATGSVDPTAITNPVWSRARSGRGSGATVRGPVPGDVAPGGRYGGLVRGSKSMIPRLSVLSASA
jgi:hypothetical protein